MTGISEKVAGHVAAPAAAETAGLIPRAVAYLFARLEAERDASAGSAGAAGSSTGSSVVVRACYAEIYNEQASRARELRQRASE